MYRQPLRLLTVLWPDREHIPHAGQFFTPYDFSPHTRG